MFVDLERATEAGLRALQELSADRKRKRRQSFKGIKIDLEIKVEYKGGMEVVVGRVGMDSEIRISVPKPSPCGWRYLQHVGAVAILEKTKTRTYPLLNLLSIHSRPTERPPHPSIYNIVEFESSTLDLALT